MAWSWAHSPHLHSPQLSCSLLLCNLTTEEEMGLSMRWDFSLQALVFQIFLKALGGPGLGLESSPWLTYCTGAGE